ncbi:MAG: hypothetical protein E7492_05940 [Ruminococcaceae bacterium]|nr:hypothetical protein [Oscillospiraceae bacterium]
MKKFIYIMSVFILAFSLAACAPDGMPTEDDSLPSIDIVERSELLDMVTVDHLFSEKDKQLMADMGITVSMSRFELDSDSTAGFLLEFVDRQNNKGIVSCSAEIDYTMLPDGSFENIRFYWGGLTKADKGLIITTPHTFYVWQPDNADNKLISKKLEFLQENNGYIVHTAYGFGRYAVMYTTADQEGVVIYDANGTEIVHITDNVKDLHIRGLLSDRTEEMVADMPFSFADSFAGGFVNENLYMIFHDGTAGVVDCEKQMLVTTLVKNGYDLTADNTTYECWLENNIDTKHQIDYDYIALKKENGIITSSVIMDTKDVYPTKYMGNRLYVDDNGNLVSYNELSGLQFTMNFDSGNSETEYVITQQMLGEKLAQSKDGKYSIYEYGRHSNKHYWVSYRAIKDNKTGQIKFLSDYYAKNYTDISLETGFFSNGEIYLMYNFDFEIYNPENVDNGPVFSLGQKFPLGIEGENGYKKNTLWAVRRDPVDKTFIVVHDHLGSDRWYSEESLYGSEYFKDTYDVALLDKEGNIIKTFATQMPVPVNTNVLNISLSGDVLTMENLAGDTGKTIQKATLNIKTGKYKKVL